MWSVIVKLVYFLLIIWWGYCTIRTYKYFDKLPKDGAERDSVSIGILAEFILLIYNVIKLLTV